MANFGQLRLTTVGIQEQYKAQSGNPLKFKRIAMGSGKYTDNIMALTKLVTENVSVDISKGYIQNNAFVVEGFFSNEGLQTGFAWREIGLFVEDANGKEVLYCYANAGDSYDYIPATSDERYSKYIRIATAIGNATNVSIIENEGILYVDTRTFQTSIDQLQPSKEKSGVGIVLDDSANLPILGMTIYGKSTQEGTPTPNTPISIESVGDDGTVDIKIYGDNLIPIPYADGTSKTMNGVTFTVNDDYSVTVDGTATEAAYFNLNFSERKLPSGYYTISNGVGLGKEIPYVQMDVYVDGVYTSTIQTIAKSATSNEFRGDVSFKACRIAVASGVTANNVRIYPMLNIGQEALPYSQPNAQSLSVAIADGLHGFPVSDGGNHTDENGQQWICDEVDFYRGVYIQRVKRYSNLTFRDAGDSYVVDGARLFTVNIDNTDDRADSTNYLSMCNKMTRNKGALLNNITGYYASYAGLFCRIQDVSDIGTFNALMAGAVFIVQLKDPIVTALSAEQIAAFKDLTAYNPNTTIINDDGADMKVQYATKTFEALMKLTEVPDGAVTREKLSHDALYSPNKGIMTANYTVTKDDLGKTLRAGADGVDFVFNFDLGATGLDNAEIAFLWLNGNSIKIKCGSDMRVGLAGQSEWLVAPTIVLPEKFTMVAFKYMYSYDNKPCWLLTGNVEVV